MLIRRLTARFISAGFSIVACAAFGLALCSAQSPETGGAQSTANPQLVPPAPGTTVLRTNANLVLVDVVVADHDNAVHGLDRNHFHIFEDGHEQAITSFDEHQPATSTATAGAFDPQAALPPHTYTNLPKYREASAVNVLLLDALNTPVQNQMDVRRQMIDFLAKIEPGTELAVFGLSSRLRMITGFTNDVAQLSKALKDPRSVQQSVVLDPDSDQALDNSITDMATMGASSSAISAMQQFQADITAFQTDQRVQMTLDAMQQLARYLSGVPGRKNLIWLSGSFPIALDPDDAQQSPFQDMRNYSDKIHETSELLSAARVAVYPVDARGLVPLASTNASYTPSSNLTGSGSTGSRRRRGGSSGSNLSNRPNPGNDDAKAMKQLMMEQATMQQVAVETGGQDYINTNGLKEALASAIDNGSSYYTVGYVPAASHLDGSFHKIEVRIENPRFKLAYRRGYFADDPRKPSSFNVGETSLIRAATLHGAPPATQIVFQVRVLPADDPAMKDTKLPAGPAGEMASTLRAPTHRVIVAVTADAHDFAFTQGAGGAQVARVEFALIAYDADGKRLNYLDRGFQMSIAPEKFAQIMKAGIPLRMALDLPPGPAFLRIAVNDLDVDRAGSLEVPVADAK